MGRLAEKIAVVAGGSSGIGLAIARRFAQEGAKVIITGRHQDTLDAAVGEVGGDLRSIQGDLTLAADLDRLFGEVQRRHARLDSLVISAGLNESRPIEEITAESYDRTFDLNARATLFAVQKAMRLMTSGGTVVLIGSIAGLVGVAGSSAYSASKAAVRSYARTWTKELSQLGIRVNILSPGPIETPMLEGASPEMRDRLLKTIPLGRFGKPEEVAAVALFLASDESSFMAGAELFLDGGLAQVEDEPV